MSSSISSLSVMHRATFPHVSDPIGVRWSKAIALLILGLSQAYALYQAYRTGSLRSASFSAIQGLAPILVCTVQNYSGALQQIQLETAISALQKLNEQFNILEPGSPPENGQPEDLNQATQRELWQMSLENICQTELIEPLFSPKDGRKWSLKNPITQSVRMNFSSFTTTVCFDETPVANITLTSEFGKWDASQGVRKISVRGTACAEERRASQSC